MSEATEYLPGAEEAAAAAAEAEEAESEIETALAVVPRVATALEARDAGIAHYLSSAYQKAGTLRLTPEETKALKADFPDDAFVTGAGGKDSLIYIDPRCLRDRLDEVLGMGGWSLVPIRTWTEEYKTSTSPAVRVYRECVFIARGVFITQATGDMSYYPNNPSQNYGDAYTGSESHALRRCLKNFGVGLQAYSKVFQVGWFERHRTGQPAEPASEPKPTPSKPTPVKPPAAKVATANTRAFVLDALGCVEEGPARNTLHSYLVALKWLDNEKVIEQWPARFVPISKEEIEALKIALGEYALNGIAVAPYQPHGLDPATLQKPAEPPKEPAWMSFIMPYGKSKGAALGKLDPKELEYYLTSFEVKTEVNGMALATESVATQKALRAALDEAKAHFEKQQQPTTKG
jgi:hypothetical protein